jgi:hypothetical protein
MFFREGLLAGVVHFLSVPVGVDVTGSFIVVVYVRKALASANKLSVVVIVHDIL